jgi:hypothetical protein
VLHIRSLVFEKNFREKELSDVMSKAGTNTNQWRAELLQI